MSSNIKTPRRRSVAPGQRGGFWDHKFGEELFVPTKRFWLSTKYPRSQGNPSINEIQEKLMEEDIFSSHSGSSDISVAQRRLIFAMLGWLSMLFLPAFDTRTPSSLNIYRAPGQPSSGLVFDDWSVSTSPTDRPLAILLKAFGNLLPARSSTSNIASELSKQAFSWTSTSSLDVNAYLLSTLLRINIQWVDTLSLHLDYDKYRFFDIHHFVLPCWSCNAVVQGHNLLFR